MATVIVTEQRELDSTDDASLQLLSQSELTRHAIDVLGRLHSAMADEDFVQVARLCAGY